MAEDSIEKARQAWQESMTRQIDRLRQPLVDVAPELVADRAGASFDGERLTLSYWGKPAHLNWPDLNGEYEDGTPIYTFDCAMLLYYLHAADGAALADRWIGFRELPDGGFYNQAFQGYSGRKLAAAFGLEPERFVQSAQTLGGMRISGLTEFAFAFTPLPRIRIAAVIWPGDEDFPAKGSVLFDAASEHYMTTDGLALLGSGLVRRLIKAG